MCIGLSPHLNFQPAIVIGGSRVPEILLNREDWQSLLEFQGVLLNYLQGVASSADTISIANIKVYFGDKVIKIEDSSQAFISIGAQSVENLFKININARLEELARKQFCEFYTSTIKRIKTLPGDTKSNLDAVLHQIHAEDKNVLLMLEAVDKIYPRVISDIQQCSA